VYTALPFVTATLDGEPFPLEVSSDGEYRVASAFIELAPGETRMLQMQLAGGLDLSAGYHLVTRSPAGVRPIPITVTVDGLSLEENQAVGDQAGGS
jgi:hypothetical protein